MFSNQSKCTISHLIKDIIKGEKELEHIQKCLLIHLTSERIGLNQCFQHLSFDKDCLNIHDLETFLQGQQIRYDKAELKYFKFSIFTNFLELILPSNQISLKQLNQKDMHQSLPVSDTLIFIAKIFNKHIEIIRRIKAHIDQLLLRFDRLQLLNYLCPQSKNTPIFLQLLKNIELDIAFEDVVCVMRRLDRDEDSDIGRVDWELWMKSSNGQCPKKPSQINHSQVLLKQKENINYNTQSLAKSNIVTLRAPIIPDEVLQFQIHLLNQGKKLAEIEEIQLELSARADYLVERAFIYFDLNMDNEIDESDLQLSNLQLGIESNPSIIRQFLKKYSQSSTEFNFNDFQNIFPIQLNIESNNNNNNDYSKVGFSYGTKKILKMLLIKFYNLIAFQKESKSAILQMGSQSCEIIFNFIDQDQDAIINQYDLQQLDIKPKLAQQFFNNQPQMNLKQFKQYFQ